MNDKLKIVILKAVMHGYSSMVANETKEESRGEQWYKQSVDINKYFNKIKSIRVANSDKELVNNVYKKLVSFDAEYFEHKLYAPYLCMFTILDYLVNELQDTSLRVKFGHFPFEKVREELHNNKEFKNLYFDSNKYMSKLLDKIGL